MMRTRGVYCAHTEKVLSAAALILALATALATAPVVVAAAAPSDVTRPLSLAVLSPGRSYVETDGASLYANICQGCHMLEGRGATGAATYPSLVTSPKLQSADDVVEIVLGGLRTMPPVGRSMSDDQVAAVVNFVRNRFGNFADDPATAFDVKALRGRRND